MIAILAGLIALIAILMAMRAFAGADTGLITRGVRWSGAAILLAAAIALAAMDRVGLAMLAGSFSWGLFTGGRVWPDGRMFRTGSAGPSNRDPGSSSGGSSLQAASTMSRSEALKVLGLEPGASRDDISAAHKRLILQTHPDRGGTSYLAAQINQAREVLLDGNTA